MKNSKSKSSKSKLVYVEWEDAEFLQHGWASAKDVLTEATAAAVIRTSGWLLARTKDYVLVAGSITMGRDSCEGVSDVMKIPAGMVRQFKVIKEY